MRGCAKPDYPLHHNLCACQISVQKLKIWDGRIFGARKREKTSGPSAKNVGTCREKTSDRKTTKFAEQIVCGLIVPIAQKKRRNPMYVRKIMVCNVTNFSYNRGPPGGGLYCGSIGSIKDRCVIGTCEKNNFFRFPLWTRVWHLKCLQDIQWECFMKTRGQNIQKRPITERPKISRLRTYRSGSVAKCLQQPVFPGGHPSKY